MILIIKKIYIPCPKNTTQQPPKKDAKRIGGGREEGYNRPYTHPSTLFHHLGRHLFEPSIKEHPGTSAGPPPQDLETDTPPMPGSRQGRTPFMLDGEGGAHSHPRYIFPQNRFGDLIEKEVVYWVGR